MKRWIPALILLAACASPEPERVASVPPKPKDAEAAPGTRVGKAAQRPSPGATKQPESPVGLDGDARADVNGRFDRGPAEPPADEAGRADFGGRIHLSNDDSMSLASAQRVLWSLAEGREPALSELRPHELLNYFTFAPAPVRREDTFAVAASAVRTEDGLALALTVTGARPERRPLDLTVLLDRSGSMEGERMAFVKRGLVRMVDRLHAGDRVNVVLFDDRVDVARVGFEVGRDDPDDLRLLFEEVDPRGATDLDAGLEAAYRVARERPTKGRDARVLVVTDAQLTAGDLNPSRVTDIARAFDETGIRLAAVGVGHDFDDTVLQGLTEKGRGAYVYVGSEKVVDRVFGSGFDALVHVVADDARFTLDLPDSLGMARFYGEEASTVAADVQPVSFYAGTTQVFLQDLAVAPDGLRKSDPLVLDLAWKDPVTGRERSQRWQGTVGDALAADPANVTKARALMAWTDLVRAGRNDCAAEKREWKARTRAFGGDVETRYLDGLVADWCGAGGDGVIAEAE